MADVTASQLGPGGVDSAGKPVFISTEHTRYAPSTERELTDQEQIAWKSFQLWRATLSMERRDNVYKGIAESDYTNFHMAYHMMGTPYPVVEPTPSIFETLKCIRWYEHGTAALAGYGYLTWLNAKASTRYARMFQQTRSALGFGTFVLMELCFCYRSMFRLSGYLPNDHECRKYGVTEDHGRQVKKKEMWEKYTAYKKEWMRRFDYHVYGIRPGDNLSLFSACWFPAWSPNFCQVTDYPLRKNPHFLTATPLREMFVDSNFHNEMEKTDNVPLVRAKPEVKYLYHGPIDATQSPK